MSQPKENLVTGHFGALTGDPVSAAKALGLRPLASQRELISDAYCDTAGFDILRAGHALRLRTTETGLDVVLESLNRAGFDDLEAQRFHAGGSIADPKRPLDPAGWPEAVRVPAMNAVGGAPVRIVCVLHETRERIPLVRGEGDDAPVVAALLLEEVRVFDSPESAGGHAIATFTELEIEPVGDDAESLARELTGHVNALDGVAVAAGSKLELALGELAERALPAIPSGIASETPMAEAGRLMWRRELLAILLNESGARRGLDIEYVHDMRVATRRARAVAMVFGPFFKKKALRPHLARLKTTARLLGAVRDRDVALLKLRRYARQRPEVERLGLSEIRAVWRVERNRASLALLAWLDSADYRRFIEEFARFCWTEGAGARVPKERPELGPAPGRVGDVMPSAILTRFEKVRSYGVLFDSNAPVRIESLHALRIDCKALRYCLQPVAHLLGEDAAEFLERLRSLQELLGDLNDAAVAETGLAALGGSIEAIALDACRAHQRSIMAKLAAEVPTAWHALIAPDSREALAVALGKL